MAELTKKISITLNCDSTKHAAIIKESLLPEINKEFQETQIHISQKNKQVTLTIAATQTNMLRAAFNSYMRWIETASSVCEQF